MPRKPVLGSLVRSMLCGALLSSTTVGTLAVVASGAMVAGCKDENDPVTHVAELSDPVRQPAAIKRLIQFYEDAMAKDKKNRKGPNVSPLVDKIIDPLTKACLDTNIKDRNRTQLVKVLSDMRDPRAEPCLKKTLEDYKPDSNEDDVQNVLRAVTAMELKSLQPQVIKVFETVEFSRPKAKQIGKDLTDAVKAVSEKSQEDYFVKLFDAPFDTSNEKALANEAYRQTVAAVVLGELKSEKAPRPLLKVILTPSKGPIANTALVAMVKIGKPSIGPTEALLKGEDKELVKWSVEESLKGAEKDKDGKISDTVKKAAEKSYIATAAQVLGSLGSEGSIKPLLAAAGELAKDEKAPEKERAEELQTKVILCLSLPQLPRDPKSVETFKGTYEAVKLDLETIAGPAKELLADKASEFYDASLVPWLVKNSAELKGESAEVDPVRSYALVTATKLMKADQVAEVQALYDTKATMEGEGGKKQETTVGKAFENEFKQAKELLANCKDGVDCYLAALTSDANQGKDKQFTGIKAAYMVGILGGEADRAKLVDALGKIPNDAIRVTALKSLEVLTPKGDEETAAKLQKYYDTAEEQKDDKAMSDFKIFVQTAARLRARAQ